MKAFFTGVGLVTLFPFILPTTASARVKVRNSWTRYSPPASSICPKDLPSKGVEVHGDFNGDGKPDIAYLEVNEKLKKMQLIVNFGGTKQDENFELQTFEGVTNDIAISLVSPSSQKIWCGKASTCADDDTHAVKLKNDSIRFTHCGGADDLYYWDEANKKFTRVEVAEPTPAPSPIPSTSPAK